MKNHTYIGRWLRDWYRTFCRELRLIFSDSGALVVFLLGGLCYPLIYNVIYHDGTLDDMPVAVVDLSQGSNSRRFLQKLDATRECALAYDCISLAEAQRLMQEQKVHGIVLIPSDYDERLERGEQATISTYADMSSFIYYKCLMMGSNYVMLNEIHDIQMEHYAASGFTGESAELLIRPVRNEENMPYNKAMSYTIFFIFAALMLVLQQTIFYGSSMIAGTLRERQMSPASLRDGSAGMGRMVLGRGAAYFSLYMVIGPIVLLLIPWLFNLPQHAQVWEVLFLMMFFVTDCIFFSFAWSSFITRRETVFVLFLFMSPICLFLTGFSWPMTAFPKLWKWFAMIFPSTFGCRAFINLNTAGGTLQTIAPEMTAMTIQTVVYYALSCLSVYVEDKILKRRQSKLSATVAE